MSLRANKAARQAHGKLQRGGQLGRGIAATYSTPTAERRAKEAGWEAKPQPGGLILHRGLPPFETIDERHFNLNEEKLYLSKLLDDYWLSGRYHVASTRAYSGEPGAPYPTGGGFLRSQAQQEANARITWIWHDLDPSWQFIADRLVLAVKRQKEGKPMSVGELGAMFSNYKRGSESAYGCAVGLVKGLAIRVREGYARWATERRRRQKEAEQRRREMDAKATVALAEVEREWSAQREVLLREYRKVVLGQRGDAHR
jgi:hypothetical protein